MGRSLRNARQVPASSSALSQEKPRKRGRVGAHNGGGDVKKKCSGGGGGSGDMSAAFSRFETWLRDTGFCWNDDELDLRASGTINAGGVFAKRNIPVGKTAVKIPKGGCITWRTSSLANALEEANARAGRAGASSRKTGGRAAQGPRISAGARGAGGRGRVVGLLPEVPAHVKLILCLIHEIHLGSQSPWAPYLATVPDFEPGIPLLWSKHEVKL